MGQLEHLAAEALWRLGRTQLGTRNRLDDNAAVDALDGVVDFEHRDDRVGAGAQLGDDRREDHRRGQAARRVVDQDQVDARRQASERAGHRVMPVGAAGDDLHVVLRQQPQHQLDLVRRGGDHHRSDLGDLTQAADRMHEQWLTGQQPQGFGSTRAEA